MRFPNIVKIVFALVVLSLLALGGRIARAAGRPIVLVTSERPDVRVARAESELVAAGLDTRRYLAPLGQKLDPDSLRRQADESGVAAVLAVVDAGLEVWLRSRLDQGLVFVELVRDHAGQERGDLAAVRAVEIVRVALLDDARPLPDAGRHTAPPPRALSSKEPHALPQLTAFAGLAGLASPSVGTMWGLHLAAGLHIGPHWSFELDIRAPVLAAGVERPEGSARVRVSTLGASVGYIALTPNHRARPHFRVGLSAAFLAADGSALPPWFGGSGVLAAPLVWGGPGTTVRLASRLHLRGDIALGITTSKMDLVFAGRSDATWGRPALLASLGLEFDFGRTAEDGYLQDGTSR